MILQTLFLSIAASSAGYLYTQLFFVGKNYSPIIVSITTMIRLGLIAATFYFISLHLTSSQLILVGTLFLSTYWLALMRKLS